MLEATGLPIKPQPTSMSSRPLFLHFHLFNTVESYCSINFFANDYIRTADIWVRKQPLYQLSHKHCPNFDEFFTIRSDGGRPKMSSYYCGRRSQSVPKLGFVFLKIVKMAEMEKVINHRADVVQFSARETFGDRSML